ncbi:MAG: DNA-directed RNA polymerase subunit delta [Bacilli bacterium]|nr:DNA-directed RNA polymerase subunit delta [Bacilli bacterium]
MKFKSVTKDELETMPFDDIAYIILKEKGKKMKINDIFQIICDELNLGPNAFESQIGDFFTLLATEKRFIQLSKGFWDLRENHTSEINISDLEDDMEDEVHDEEDNEDDEEERDYYDELDDIEDDVAENDLKDLVVIDEKYEDDIDL